MPTYSDLSKYHAQKPDGSLVYDEEDIAQAIGSLLDTRIGQRLFRPEYGCGIHSLVFEPMNAATEFKLMNEVYDAVSKWEPRVILDSSRSFVVANTTEQAYDVTLVYKILGLDYTSSYTKTIKVGA